MTTETRQVAYRLGHVAEWRAVWRLRFAGYSILARRYKTKLGEIDRFSAAERTQRQGSFQEVDALAIARAQRAKALQLAHSGGRHTSGRWRGHRLPTSTASKRIEWAA